MARLSLQVAFSLAFLGLLLQPCQGLKCHQCNSNLDSDCGDPFSNTFTNGSSLLKTSRFLLDCPKKEDDLCRKIYQYIRDEESIVRECGQTEIEKKDKMCYLTRSEEYSTEVCQCRTDGCNGAGRTAGQAGVALMLCSAVAWLALWA